MEIEENETDGISCILSFILFDDGNIQFDCSWMSEEDARKMALLIKAITKTDFIKKNIEGMETSDEKGRKLILKSLSSKPHISPLEVYANLN
jgi:hypothetical protein